MGCTGARHRDHIHQASRLTSVGNRRTAHSLHSASVVVRFLSHRIWESGSGFSHSVSREMAPETHTFHLPLGEATITLIDVAVLTRLPIEGHAVCTVGRQLDSWRDIVDRVLGVRLPAEIAWGSRLRITWLAQNFAHPPNGADEATIEKYAKAYLLYLIGAVLFADKSGKKVQLLYLTLPDAPWDIIVGYSWGSAALGYLYRRLYGASRKNVKEIVGPLIILQLWAWEHILIGQPMRSVGRGAFAPPILPPLDVPYGSRWSFYRRRKTHTGSGVGFYRDQLDLLRPDQFRWDPYPADVYAALLEHSGILSGAWRASVPLICFDIVKVHLPERVLRQFGIIQGIPPPCDTEVELHQSSRKGREPKNRLEINGRHIAQWDHRLELLARGAPIDDAVAPTSAGYMTWFLSITRRYNYTTRYHCSCPVRSHNTYDDTICTYYFMFLVT